MPTELPPSPPLSGVGRNCQTYLGVAALAILAALVYANSFRVPFLFDDITSITANPSIQHLGPGVTFPPGHTTVESRPLVNLSLAVNYAISGSAPWSYHAVNLLIHLGAALFLAGIVRRSIRLWWPRSTDRKGDILTGFFAAALWLVHPLNTEAVTYVVQRTESMMALCFLATLYFFIRGATEPGREKFLSVSLVLCYVGMGTKEVMVMAPVVVLLFDVLFVSRSLAKAWETRRRYYVLLGLSWVALACFIARSPTRLGEAAFAGQHGPIAYWAAQPVALFRYLHAAISPRHLTFDYGIVTPSGPEELGAAAGLLALLVLIIWQLRRHKAFGFALAATILVLAVTSLVPGNRQTMADHRMYLPLAFLVGALTATAAQLWSRQKVYIAAGIGCMIFSFGTWMRNADYINARSIWADTVEKVPGNAYAHNNLGAELLKAGDVTGAQAQFLEALRLFPTLAIASENLGSAYLRQGLLGAAALAYRDSIRSSPDNCSEHNGLGVVLMRSGDLIAARVEFVRSIELDPAFVLAQQNLKAVLIEMWKDHTDELPGFAHKVVPAAKR